MGAHLRAIDAMDAAERFLHKRMPALGFHGLTVMLRHDGLRIPEAPRIVDDGLAGMQMQEIRSEQAHHVIAFHKISRLIYEKAPVKIAVPGDPHIRSGPLHRLDQGAAAFLQHRIGHPVRECAVRLHIQLRKLKGQMLRQLPEYRTGAPVACIHHQMKRLHTGYIHIGQNMTDIVIHDIPLCHGSLSPSLPENHRQTPFSQSLSVRYLR